MARILGFRDVGVSERLLGCRGLCSKVSVKLCESAQPAPQTPKLNPKPSNRKPFIDQNLSLEYRSGNSFIPFLVWRLFNSGRSLPRTYKPPIKTDKPRLKTDKAPLEPDKPPPETNKPPLETEKPPPETDTTPHQKKPNSPLHSQRQL